MLLHKVLVVEIVLIGFNALEQIANIFEFAIQLIDTPARLLHIVTTN